MLMNTNLAGHIWRFRKTSLGVSLRTLTRKRNSKQNERDEMQDKPGCMARFPAHAPGIPVRRENSCIRRMEESCVCRRHSPKEDNRESQEKTDGCTKCQSQRNQTTATEDSQEKDREHSCGFNEPCDSRRAPVSIE